MHTLPLTVIMTSLFRRNSPAPRQDQSFRDPLAHPDLARMDERELADLQFMPGRVSPD